VGSATFFDHSETMRLVESLRRVKPFEGSPCRRKPLPVAEADGFLEQTAA
jgi:hypothetical protein